MEMTMATHVPKEEIMFMNFLRTEVLNNPEAIRQRESLLEKACELGNQYQGKVRIVFQTTDGPKEVQTTIWGVTKESISLKNGIWIPIKAILNVFI